MPPIDDNEQPADDIRSALAAAISEHGEPGAAPEKPARASAKPEASDAGEVTPADKATAKRGPSGKFAKAADKPEAEAAEDEAEAKDKSSEAAEKPAEDEKLDADEKPETEAAATEPPANWSPKDKEAFKKLAPEGQEFIIRRHREMEARFTKKTQEIAAFRKEFDPVQKLLEPWKDRMQAKGYTPQSLITAWANVEKRLMDGDGVGVVASLVKGYGLDMGKIAQALGLRPLARAPTQDGEQPAPVQNGDATHLTLPPEITQTLQSLQQRLDAQDRDKADSARRAENSAVQKAEADLEQFKSAQDDKGQLLHPHFDDLETDMLLLAQAAIAARKPVPPLTDLYETAVWANPSTRKAKLAADAKAQQAKSAEEARAKAAAAKKAGSSVTGAPGSGQATGTRPKAEQTLREQLLEAAAERESAL